MKRVFRSTAMAVLALVAGFSHADGGVYEDDLVRCLVSNTGDDDRGSLVRWMVLAYAQHPEVSPVVGIPASALRDTQKEMGHLFNRLLLEDCRSEALNAARYEGEIALVNAIVVMSRVAGRELSSDPSVSKAIEGYIEYTDEAGIQRLLSGR